MLIIDSLLNFNFFLSGEVQENLSLFLLPSSSAHRKGTGRYLQSTQLGSVIRMISAEHRKKACSSFLMTATTACSGAFP